MIAGGVTAFGWMLNLPNVRVPCSEPAVRVTYITPTGTYCEGSNPFEQPWLAVVAVVIGIGLLIVSSRLERRVGWMVHRLITGLTHGSVLFALSLSFVVFSFGSCEASAPVSGYQMLSGFDFPVSDLNLSPIFSQHFGPNPAIVVLVAVGVIRPAASMWAGGERDVVRPPDARVGICSGVSAALFVPHGLVFNWLEVYLGR